MHNRELTAVPGTWPSPPPKRAVVPATPPISALIASAILAVLIQVYAGATLRGVYADGAHYAIQLAAQHIFRSIQHA